MGYIEASSKKEARVLIEEDFNSRVCMKSKRDDIGTKNIFMVNIYEPDEYWDEHWSGEKECSVCSQVYTNIKRAKTFDYQSIRSGYCCLECEEVGELKIEQNRENIYLDRKLEENNGIELPCIYKITHKTTNKVYIGQTTQAVTYRWYQHFKTTSGGTKFYDEIENSDITDWTFEVVEVIDKKAQNKFYTERTKGDRLESYINQREQHYINLFDSISNGYNSAVANATLNKIYQEDKDGLFNNAKVEGI